MWSRVKNKSKEEAEEKVKKKRAKKQEEQREKVAVEITWRKKEKDGKEEREDVCRRQILTYKDGPRTERIKIFLMVVDPQHRYSNESERANSDSYGDFKLEKTTLVSMGLKKIQRN